VNAIFEAIIADDIPYRRATTLVSCLNHEKNFDARSIRSDPPKIELIPIENITNRRLNCISIIICRTRIKNRAISTN
jgi:hypothetical protein